MTEKIITPFLTNSYLEHATDNIEGGVGIKCAYVQVGRGKQTIKVDDYGRAITDKLLDPVGYVEIYPPQKISPYQWQLTVNLNDIDLDEWAFSEFAVCDEDKRVISIFGINRGLAIIYVTPFLNHALLTINFGIGTLPANSIEIIHNNIPLELINVSDLLAMDIAIGQLSLAQVKNYNDRQQSEKKFEAKQAETEKLLRSQANEINQMRILLRDLISYVDDQQQFNLFTEQSVGNLSLAVINN